MPNAESGSEEYSASLSKHFSESQSTSTYISTAYGIYGSEVADNVLKNDNAYVWKSDNGPIKEGVLVKTKDGYEFIYLYNGKALKTQINTKNVKFDSNGNATINWDRYYIDYQDGTIKQTSPIEDINDNSGNKTFMEIRDNGVDKNVYVVKEKINDTFYWVPVKVDVNNNGDYQFVEIQNKGKTIPHYGSVYVQIKIGDSYYYLDKAEIENSNFKAISWDRLKNKFTPAFEIGPVTYDYSRRQHAIDDMKASKTSYSETNSKVLSVSNSYSNSKSTSLIVSASTSLSAVASRSASESASTSESTSGSISDSVSESLSVSESESISGSMSDSVSTSTAVSESLSNSLSSSESNSLSSSESASVSDSFATSVTTTTAGGDTTYRRVVVDTRAPLQVAPRETEEVVEDETPKANPEEQTETIKKEKMPKSTLDVTHRVWWSWVPIVGALVSLVNAHASKKARNDASKERNDASKEKEDK